MRGDGRATGPAALDVTPSTMTSPAIKIAVIYSFFLEDAVTAVPSVTNLLGIVCEVAMLFFFLCKLT